MEIRTHTTNLKPTPAQLSPKSLKLFNHHSLIPHKQKQKTKLNKKNTPNNAPNTAMQTFTLTTTHPYKQTHETIPESAQCEKPTSQDSTHYRSNPPLHHNTPAGGRRRRLSEQAVSIQVLTKRETESAARSQKRRFRWHEEPYTTVNRQEIIMNNNRRTVLVVVEEEDITEASLVAECRSSPIITGQPFINTHIHKAHSLPCQI